MNEPNLIFQDLILFFLLKHRRNEISIDFY
jgi:hypothetical protein